MISMFSILFCSTHNAARIGRSSKRPNVRRTLVCRDSSSCTLNKFEGQCPTHDKLKFVGQSVPQLCYQRSKTNLKDPLEDQSQSVWPLCQCPCLLIRPMAPVQPSYSRWQF